MKGCILFTDIKSSSKLWAAHPKQMLKLLMEHEKIIRDKIIKNKGFIVKTIGDAVMAKFSSVEEGVKCAIDIQQVLKNKPLRFNKSTDLLQIRIGLAYGDMQMRNILIQGHKLKDFFGTSVNMASRMESKVSKVGGFGILADTISKKTLELLRANCNLQKVDFKYRCNEKIQRSGRLIAFDQNSICHDITMLHVEDGLEHAALSCELK